jgi:hypothetical protein
MGEPAHPVEIGGVMYDNLARFDAVAKFERHNTPR